MALSVGASPSGAPPCCQGGTGSTVNVENNPKQGRYEAHIDGNLAGFAEYMLSGDKLIVFTHTEVEPNFEGQGVGSKIARFALDDVRDDGSRSVLPLCPFIKGWILRHPDYKDLVYRAKPSNVKD